MGLSFQGALGSIKSTGKPPLVWAQNQKHNPEKSEAKKKLAFTPEITREESRKSNPKQK